MSSQTDPITREQVIAAARTWLGTPFEHQGRRKGPHGRLDCIGLPLMVAISLGIRGKDGAEPSPAMFGSYPPQPIARGSAVREWCEKLLIEKPAAQRLPGDVLAMRLPLEPCHCAIVGELDLSGKKVQSLIHAYPGVGKVVEHILDIRWSWRIDGCFSFPGVSIQWP